MLGDFWGEILAAIASAGTVLGGAYTTVKWYRRRHSSVVYFKYYCEHSFFYFKSFVNKLVHKSISRPLPDGRYINYALAIKNRFYAKDVTSVRLRFLSKVILYQLPYKEEIDYIASPDSRIFIKNPVLYERFELSEELRNLTDPILENFISEKPNTTDGPALRMQSFFKLDDYKYQCNLQLASYFDQVRTNLTLDVPIQFDETVRIADLGKDRSVRDLSESIMANTIGVSAVWFIEDRNGDKNNRLRFFLRPRRKTTGVFTDMLGTISGVVEPPANNVFTEGTLEEYMIKEIRREFYQETGYDLYMRDNSLTEDDVTIIPLAFMRELTRGGKPQFFFAITTPYVTERAMSKYFKLSYNGREEFYSDIRSRFMMYKLSPETMVNLMLTYKFIQRKQNLEYIDFS